jgi:hypothetical protein
MPGHDHWARRRLPEVRVKFLVILIVILVLAAFWYRSTGNRRR